MRNFGSYALGRRLPAVMKAGCQASKTGQATQAAEGSRRPVATRFRAIFGQRQARHTNRDTTVSVGFGGVRP